MIYKALALLLLAATSADAGRVVMFYGDSRTGWGGTSSYPALVDQARTDFTACNKGLNGRTAQSGVGQIAAALTQCQATGDVTDGVIMLGVSDALLGGGMTSAIVADNLATIADYVEMQGVRAWIVQEPPGPLAWGGWIDARKWTRDNAFEVGLLSLAGYRVIQMRDEFVVTDWFACSSDDLHPTGLACRQAMATQPIAVLP